MDTGKRSRGRPKDLQCRERIMIAASDLFMLHGMQAVSVDQIAMKASVSNKTVYSHFSGKEILLWEVIRHAGESLKPKLPSTFPTSEADFVEAITAFGIAFVCLLTNPRIINLGKLMISESARHPELAKQFFDWGPLQVQNALAAFVTHGVRQGWLLSTTPKNSAHHLFAMWNGTWHFKQQLGLSRRLSRPEIESLVTESLDVFLSAYSSSRSPSR